MGVLAAPEPAGAAGWHHGNGGWVEDSPLYTRESANALLPEVREHLERLRAASGTLEGHDITAASRKGSNGGGSGARDWLGASTAAAEELTWFGEAGIVLRDIGTGLLDFPARRDGRDIFLCWRSGEDSVDFWHGPDTGFAGRQPLEPPSP